MVPVVLVWVIVDEGVVDSVLSEDVLLSEEGTDVICSVLFSL